MRKLHFAFFAFIYALSGCNNAEEKKNVVLKTKPANIKFKTVTPAVKVLEVPWIVMYNDSTEVLEIKKNPNSDVSNLTSKDIIEALNIKYPQIKLELVDLKGNKAFVKINDATYLTQQIGSTGAQAYFAEATFSLTEVDKINAVSFDFKEGDHASPQTFTRESFKDFN